MGHRTRHRVRSLSPTQTPDLNPRPGRPGADTLTKPDQPSPRTSRYTNAPEHTHHHHNHDNIPEPTHTPDNPATTETLGLSTRRPVAP